MEQKNLNINNITNTFVIDAFGFKKNWNLLQEVI